MVTFLEVALLALVVVLVFGAYRVVQAVKPLIVNAVVGLIVILLADLVGLGVVITPVVVLLVAFGGVPAAALVILLARLDIVFQPALLALPV